MASKYLAWVFSMTFLGYFLGKVAGAKTIEKVVYLIIFVSVAPLAFGAIRQRLAKKPEVTPNVD